MLVCFARLFCWIFCPGSCFAFSVAIDSFLFKKYDFLKLGFKSVCVYAGTKNDIKSGAEENTWLFIYAVYLLFQTVYLFYSVYLNDFLIFVIKLVFLVQFNQKHIINQYKNW